jgi:hypothetical protein
MTTTACSIAADMVLLQDNSQWLLKKSRDLRCGRSPLVGLGVAPDPTDLQLHAVPLAGALALHSVGLAQLGHMLAQLPAANDDADPSGQGGDAPAPAGSPLGPFAA